MKRIGAGLFLAAMLLGLVFPRVGVQLAAKDPDWHLYQLRYLYLPGVMR